MNYIIVLPEGGLSSKERATSISEKLFELSRPLSARDLKDASKYRFSWIDHPTEDKRALLVDLDYEIYVHPDKDVTALTELFPEVSSEETTQLANFIESSTDRKFRFGDIIPSTATVRDEEYMITEGWIEEEPDPEELLPLS